MKTIENITAPMRVQCYRPIIKKHSHYSIHIENLLHFNFLCANSLEGYLDDTTPYLPKHLLHNDENLTAPLYSLVSLLCCLISPLLLTCVLTIYSCSCLTLDVLIPFNIKVKFDATSTIGTPLS